MKIFLVLNILIFSLKSEAVLLPTSYLEFNFGLQQSSIENPIGSDSVYSGYVMQLYRGIPLSKGNYNALYFNIGARYSEFKNIKEFAGQTEDGKSWAPSLGFVWKLPADRWAIGADANYNFSSYKTSGGFTNEVEYKFLTYSYYAEYIYPAQYYFVGIRLGGEMGKIPGEETSLSEDVNYSAYSVWLFFTLMTP